MNLLLRNPFGYIVLQFTFEISMRFKNLNSFFIPVALLFTLAAVSCSEKQTETTKQEVISEKAEETKADQKTILFFGNSLTAAYGIDPEDGFAGLTQQRIDSLGLNYRVINGGLSGETTAGGVGRLDWFLEEKPDIFVLELGGNDGLRGIAISETKKNLMLIIDKVREKYPDTKIILAGMQIPPNMGTDYAREFTEIYPAVAEEKDVTLIPFLLENVGGIKELNLPDGIHPTEEGHQIVFETIWPYIQKNLE
ncbi:acyl-CoA thioesterase-1 [Algoriphagus yeomjeoni]|uniref:Acyl-CoA thioesterase-1 n=2 Tax=Algoriphagus yeomjeoni TaxID=291403 RepID=A0A327PI37_9BACT|nr:acyl-CoA thioesterase-1 [Algoriphagus yeomjeoni]